MSTPNKQNEAPQPSLLAFLGIPLLFNVTLAVFLTILWNFSLVPLGAATLSISAGIGLWFFFVLVVTVPVLFIFEYVRSAISTLMLEEHVRKNSFETVKATFELSRNDVIKIVDEQMNAALNLKEDEILALIEQQVKETLREREEKNNGLQAQKETN